MRRIFLIGILFASGTIAAAVMIAQMPAGAANAASATVTRNESTVSGSDMAGTITPPRSREATLAYVRGLSLVARRIDSIEAKLTTWGQWSTVNGQPQTIGGFDPQTLVWVVSVSGSVELPVNQGMTTDWGAVIIDATTGKPMSAAGGNLKPNFFVTLIDLGRP